MLLRKTISALIFSVIFLNSSAQIICGADQKQERLIAQDADYKKQVDDLNSDIKRYISANPAVGRPSSTTAALYYIPVVVHVIYDGDPTTGTLYNPSTAQINAAIAYVNAVYDGTWAGVGGPILGVGNLDIKFVLATKDPNNNATTGIERINGAALAGYSASGMKYQGASGATELSIKNLSRWDPEKYYNIWVVNRIDGCSGYFCGCACDAGTIGGFALFPVSPANVSGAMRNDGTVMLASQFNAGQKVLPHELGHMLSVYHPFQGNTIPGPNTCVDNTFPTTSGDLCADTDPITNPYLSPNIPFACRIGINPCTSTAFTANTEKNYMNYTNCYQLFTADQKARMIAATSVSQRASLVTSWANDQGSYPAPFVQPIVAAVSPLSSLFLNNTSGILRVDLNNRTVYSLNATQDGGYLDNSSKWYDLFDLHPSTTYTMTVTVLNSNSNYQFGAWLDYDNSGTFNSTNEQLYLQNDIAPLGAASVVSFSFTTPAAGSANFIRLRLATDLSTIFGVGALSNTSTSLDYGQAEDYPVYITGAVVPVKLLSFNAKKSSENISLIWETSDEVNISAYDVERSFKGSPFRSFATVTATGNQQSSRYNLLDRDVRNSGKYLYRLKIKNLDGSHNYSPERLITISKDKLIVENPFNQMIHLILPNSNSKASFRLADAAGRIIYTSPEKTYQENDVILNLSNVFLSKGLYILDAVINGERFTEKLVKN